MDEKRFSFRRNIIPRTFIATTCIQMAMTRILFFLAFQVELILKSEDVTYFRSSGQQKTITRGHHLIAALTTTNEKYPVLPKRNTYMYVCI